MSTDATGCIEIVGDLPAIRGRDFSSPYQWAQIRLRRDYDFFSLLPGAGMGAGLVEHRPVRWPNCEDDDPGSTWMWSLELARVADAYFSRKGTEYPDARAIVACMNALNELNPRRTRLLLRFF